MANMQQLVYRPLPRRARASSAPELGCSLACGKPQALILEILFNTVCIMSAILDRHWIMDSVHVLGHLA
jgi:hypothetical protein